MPRERWTRATPVLTIQADEAAAMLRPALGAVDVVGLDPLTGGHSNTNVRVRLGHAPGNVVLRLYQRDPAQMRKEAALARLVAGRVPAPAFLYCGTRNATGQNYAIVEWIDGQPLQALVRQAGEDQLATAADDIGQALAAIHSFTFARAGFLDGDLNITPFPGGETNSGFLETIFAGVAGERLGKDFAAEVVAYAKANEHRAATWNEPPRLTHFDFGSSNILVRDDVSLAGIVDWEFAAAASPAADFGNLLRPPLGHSTAFVEGIQAAYRASGGYLPDDWRALTRLADMGAWAEFLSRPNISEALIADARLILAQTIGRAPP
jgi:aminoglycoside phosphotransferase (APT) family kinase protein